MYLSKIVYDSNSNTFLFLKLNIYYFILWFEESSIYHSNIIYHDILKYYYHIILLQYDPSLETLV